VTPNEPPSEEAEAVVLGTLMHHPAAHAEAAEIIDRADFHPSNQLIWDVVTDLVTEGKAVSPITVIAALQAAGQLHRVRGGDLIWEISGQAQPPGVIGEYAAIIKRSAELRSYDEFAVRLRNAVATGADPETIDDLIGEHLEARRQRGARVTSRSSVLDWDAFFATDFTTTTFLPGKIMAEGQQIAVVGDGKAGKSLFCQDWAWRMSTGQPFLGDHARDPIRTLYLDAENGQDEIQRRFVSLGAGPGRMGELQYASFPPIPPLDTPAGGLALMAMVHETKAQVVFIDTVSRFIDGEENDADTWLALYRCTLMLLKRAGVASVRLDHFGKDKDRGSRGSSAKTQDVDHVWELTAQGDGGLSLRRTHTRTGVGQDVFGVRRMFQKRGDDYVPGATRHVLAGDEYGQPVVPGGVEDIVQRLDRAGVPSDWGRERLAAKGVELGIKAAKAKWEEVVRVRKSRSGDLPPNLPYSQVTISGETCPDNPGQHIVNTQVRPAPGSSGAASGQQAADLPAPSLPLGRGQVGQPGQAAASGRPLCGVCGERLSADWARRGYDTHLMCKEDS
jgi:hypothetical protein